MKARYLTFFSYIGTPFRSSQKLWHKQGHNYPDPESVQGMIELALCKLKSLNYPVVTLSSRTDGGVHALNASAHFDLVRFGDKIYEPNYIVFAVNKFFYDRSTSITLNKCYRVADNFSARFQATQRVYLYRLAVLKKNVEVDHNSIGSYIPIEEWRRCHFVSLKDFNIDKFKEGAKYFVGYHDFTTFRKFDKLKQQKHNRRELTSIEVRPGRPLTVSSNSARDSKFDYWDIEIKGRAFVHNQIRRMIGTLISVAVGNLSPPDIKVMLQVPSKHSWYSSIQVGPPDGLYLCDVEYNQQDLLYASSEESEHKVIDTDSDVE